MSTQPQQTTAVAQKPAKPIDTVRSAFEAMKPQFAMVLPKHVTPDRMVRVALTAIQNTPKLLDCDKTSLYSAVMRAAQLGLEPDGVLGQAYLIPYGKTVQFIPGYKGLIDLARRSGEVSNIIAKEVYANDDFTVDFAKDIPFEHKPKLSGERGEVTHFWAMAKFKDGGFHWDYMTRDEVEKIRDKGNGKNNAVWKDHFIEMGKKTAIRRIAKYLPMSVQKAAMVEDLVEAGKSFTTDQYGDITIDGEATVTPDDMPQVEAPKNKLDAFADPETGEVIEQNTQAAASPAPEPEPKPAIQDFDPAQYNLNTQSGTKKAMNDMVAYLASLPQEQRNAEYSLIGGDSFVSAAGRHGLGMMKSKLIEIGVQFGASVSEAA